MHVPVLRQTCACCHGAAIADKRRGERIAQKHAVGLIRGQKPPFAIGTRANRRVRCVNFGEDVES
jgi:hypothetical protein